MTTKIVGITGVKGGIGQALASEFARANYQVVGVDLNWQTCVLLSTQVRP